jgi:hypothetical protein
LDEGRRQIIHRSQKIINFIPNKLHQHFLNNFISS